ncbi:hypothetical protein FocTR4_00005478 [Fusarium oxysporum f. sp. cubense]|uniref:Uncharacterized protein n=1 Tax=Fusarium oxysporum f. sp. cubense TaxID=61366 RepID=A0A5C6TG24_FUSOC|nr:hypothetical protein FocTR4_00005478 [Fusarium oxysporum f. sp. cubense]
MKFKAIASLFGHHDLNSCLRFCPAKSVSRERMRKHNRIFLSFLINQCHWF